MDICLLAFVDNWRAVLVAGCSGGLSLRDSEGNGTVFAYDGRPRGLGLLFC
jgi:hypothetical protein